MDELERLKEALLPVIAEIVNILAPAIKHIIESLSPVLGDISGIWEQILRSHPNRRVVELAFRHPKARVRKKNRHRIIKDMGLYSKREEKKCT